MKIRLLCLLWSKVREKICVEYLVGKESSEVQNALSERCDWRKMENKKAKKRSYFYFSSCNSLKCSEKPEYKENLKKNAGFSRSWRSTPRDRWSGPIWQHLRHFFHPFLVWEVETQHVSSAAMQCRSLNFSPIPELRNINTEVLFNWWKRSLSTSRLRWKLLVHRIIVTWNYCPGYASQKKIARHPLP